ADAELDFEAHRFRAAEFPLLQSVKVQAALADGRLALNAFDLGLAKGHATGRAALDLREPAMAVEADVQARGLRLEAMLPEQKAAKRITGSLQARVEVKAAGDSLAALLASATGSITASLADATISSRLDAEMGLQGGKILRSMITGAEPIAIGCAAMVLDLQRGSGRVRTLVIDTEHTRTTGTGTIGLRDRSLDLVLTPQAKQGGLFVLDRSIRLHGPLLKPQHSLVDRAAAVAGRACAG
ncbi:MAG: AsmA family protein, partial [Pseudomonadota bacterium]|nr:AsmA family protein [Pseudomonadota bacterium]